MTTLHFPFVSAFGENPLAAASPRDEFVGLWRDAPWQQRRNCVEDHRLTAAALWMCQDMAKREEEGSLAGDLHMDSLGRNANGRVRAFFPLPDGYEDGLNYVESVAIADIRHYDVPYVLQMLLDSPSHHPHIVGEGWFAGQTVWGCAFVAPSWWTLITAPP